MILNDKKITSEDSLQNILSLKEELTEYRELNLYEILKLNQNATREKVKVSYDEMSSNFMSDQNTDNPILKAKFSSLSSICEFLCNNENRKIYDDTLNKDKNVENSNSDSSEQVQDETGTLKFLNEENYRHRGFL